MNRDPRRLGSHLRPPSDLNPRTDAPLDFVDREFGRLSEADYAELGFMGGLEVHQQLATTTKLFCRCPSGVYVDRYDADQTLILIDDRRRDQIVAFELEGNLLLVLFRRDLEEIRVGYILNPDGPFGH